MKYDKIVVEPKMSPPEDNYCPLSNSCSGCIMDDTIRCRYGLTDIEVPTGCPLLKGPVVVKLKLPRKEVRNV